MRASIIIPAFNAHRTLARCLTALDVQTLAPNDYEVIVVDDGSTDATASLVAFFHRARYIFIPHAGAAAARNRGASVARGDILLFTDADCEPQPDWIEKMLGAFADPRIVGAKGTYRTRQREWAARFVQLEYAEKYERMRRARTIDFVDTYSAAYRREIFLQNHGFDESFPTASVEDQEFSFRLVRQGHPMVFVPEAIVYHQHAATLGAYLRRKFWIGYWKVRVHILHPSKLWHDSHTPPTQKLQTLLFLGMLALIFVIPFVSLAWVGELALTIIFAISALPLVVFVARRDAPMTWIVPLMIGLRAGALGLGLAAGMLGEFGLRWMLKKPNTGNQPRDAV
jgi:cellulose synthase/poly-beta-1,6-N-acetylglucosamine synthase-like glycosyltransferase